MFFHQSWLLQQATISLNVYAIHKNSLPLQSDANFCICLGHQCPLDQAEKARGATQRGTLSAYTFLIRNFMLTPKIFGKRASPDANGSYGRGYGR